MTGRSNERRIDDAGSRSSRKANAARTSRSGSGASGSRRASVVAGHRHPVLGREGTLADAHEAEPACAVAAAADVDRAVGHRDSLPAAPSPGPAAGPAARPSSGLPRRPRPGPLPRPSLPAGSGGTSTSCAAAPRAVARGPASHTADRAARPGRTPRGGRGRRGVTPGSSSRRDATAGRADRDPRDRRPVRQEEGPGTVHQPPQRRIVEAADRRERVDPLDEQHLALVHVADPGEGPLVEQRLGDRQAGPGGLPEAAKRLLAVEAVRGGVRPERRERRVEPLGAGLEQLDDGGVEADRDGRRATSRTRTARAGGRRQRSPGR